MEQSSVPPTRTGHRQGLAHAAAGVLGFVLTCVILQKGALVHAQDQSNVIVLESGVPYSGRFTAFTLDDYWENPDASFRGPQIIFEIEPTSLLPANIVITTCGSEPASSINFGVHATAFLVDLDPLTANVEPTLIEFSREDHYCFGNANVQTTLVYQVSNQRAYYLVLQLAEPLDAGQVDFTLRYTRENIPARALSWALDRIDQRNLPLNGQDTVSSGGSGTFIYVLDTGIRIDHEQFTGGRAEYGRNFVDPHDGEDYNSEDCNGHGTHVASLAAGATVGVAYDATVIGVRVLNCNNTGLLQDVLDGMAWVIQNVTSMNRYPAVLTASISSRDSVVDAINEMVVALEENGISFVGSAGNDGGDSCTRSPASAVLTSSATSVGATNIQDERYEFSNSGRCTTIWAPGVNVTGADIFGASSYSQRTGTSFAAPLVAGTLAIFYSLNPTSTPQEARNTLTYTSTPGVVSGLQDDDFSRFLYVRSVPVLDLGPPPSGQVFIYSVTRYRPDMVQCTNDAQLRQLADGLAQSIAFTPNSNMKTPLCGTNVTGLSGLLEVVFQLLDSELSAALSFEALEAAYEDGSAESAMGVPYVSYISPWVVDSNGNTYWAPPRFENSEQSGGLSGGAIAGIVIGAVAGALLLVGAAYLAYLRTRPAPESKLEGMYGTAEPLDEDIEFHDEAAGGPALSSIFSGRLKGLGSGKLFSPRGQNAGASGGLISPRGTKKAGGSRNDLKSPRGMRSRGAGSEEEEQTHRILSMGGEAFAHALRSANLDRPPANGHAVTESGANGIFGTDSVPDPSTEAGHSDSGRDSSLDPELLLRAMNSFAASDPAANASSVTPIALPSADADGLVTIPLSPRGADMNS
ncbi:Extracellular serine proteinase [Porphyridium purpureum]|uniref:Extracellular serine proteinase n=1 Tax=Porphyridium purpureum TaxID=35688 RepID=A0A5J4Z395_PORPP|nr:Extracellular serine proteinase [Porphyridium purpureum]|eukprot:POR1100..scf295_1